MGVGTSRYKTDVEGTDNVLLSTVGHGVPDYLEENVSAKVVKIIQSWVGIVNKQDGVEEEREG